MASTMSIATSVLQALRYCAPQNKGYEGILVFDYVFPPFFGSNPTTSHQLKKLKGIFIRGDSFCMISFHSHKYFVNYTFYISLSKFWLKCTQFR